MTAAARIVSLLSAGRHPATGRPRRSDLDARGLELALRLTERAHAALEAVHAGAPGDAALKDYLGMGLASITVIDVASESDPSAALIAYLRAAAPDVVVAGACAEDGLGTGLTPYEIANALKVPIVAEICAVEFAANALVAVQALERGARRRLLVRTPCVITVCASAPAPRAVAYARARRGRINALPNPDAAAMDSREWAISPAKMKPRSIAGADPNDSPEERLKAITEMATRGGAILKGLTPEAAAERLLAELKESGVFASENAP